MSERVKPIVDKPIDYAEWWDRPGIVYDDDVDVSGMTPLEGREWEIVDGKVVFTDGKDADAGS